MMWFAVFLGITLLQGIASEQPDYDWDTETSLDAYVQGDDGFYSWEILDTYRYNDTITMYIVNMTSQKYMDEDFVTCSVWWHFMGIAIPDEPRNLDYAVLAITGGSNNPDSDYPGQDDPTTVGMATMSEIIGIPVAYIMYIPNQPCYFENDPTYRRRTEDSIIAWTWRTYYDEDFANPDMVLRNPMTKGAKRGLDTIQAVCAQERDGCNIEQFFVMGSSKRGWTTWSLAATDRRVVAQFPIVFDLLNIQTAIMAHFQAMDAAYSFALYSYYRENLTHHLWSDEIGPLWDMEDMIRYRSRFDGRPKYLLVGSTDEFFHFQDVHYWWDMMPGPKHMYLCANGDHSLVTCWAKALDSVMGYMVDMMEDIPRPDISFSRHQTEGGESGHILMHTNPPPHRVAHDDLRCGNPFPGGYKVRAWTAETVGPEIGHNRRDWRLMHGWPDQEIHGILWGCENNTVVIEESDEFQEAVTFRFDEDAREGRWMGFFLESEYMSSEGLTMYFTTEGNIIPDTFPAEPCDSDETCYGYMV